MCGTSTSEREENTKIRRPSKSNEYDYIEEKMTKKA